MFTYYLLNQTNSLYLKISVTKLCSHDFKTKTFTFNCWNFAFSEKGELQRRMVAIFNSLPNLSSILSRHKQWRHWWPQRWATWLIESEFQVGHSHQSATHLYSFCISHSYFKMSWLKLGTYFKNDIRLVLLLLLRFLY